MTTIPDYTTVVGVDGKHLPRLRTAWASWRLHKQSLLNHPMLVFRDRDQVTEKDIREAVDHPNLTVCHWPPDKITYTGSRLTGRETDREKYASLWTDCQRHKMLAGYVHVPALFVQTPYWLKLDTSAFAVGMDDWIDPEWFRDKPAIISHRWGYTKPPDQMVVLDKWVEDNADKLWVLWKQSPLNLQPPLGADKLTHKRIISWCAFFGTQFTRQVSYLAASTCGVAQIPVPSQDGCFFYVAKRMGLGIKRVDMKAKGWEHRQVRDFSIDVLRK